MEIKNLNYNNYRSDFFGGGGFISPPKLNIYPTGKRLERQTLP